MLFSSGSNKLPNKNKCCGDESSQCFDLDFDYNELTYILTLYTECGNSTTVDLTSLAPDGVVVSVTYDPVTGLLTITTSVGSTYQVTLYSGLTIANTLFVTENGNDATGERESPDKPYATPWGAIAAALPGDTVVVYPHLYEFPTQVTTQRLVKDGVKMFCHPGVDILFSSTSFTALTTQSPFSDDGVPMVSGIYGHAKIRYNGTAATNLTPVLSHPDSVLDIECHTLENRTRLTCTSATRFTIKAHKHIGHDTSLVRMFNNVAQPTVFIHDVDEVEQLDTYRPPLVGNGTYGPFQLDNFSEGGSIFIRHKLIRYRTSFFSQGLFFCQRLSCPVTIDSTVYFSQDGVAAYEDDYNLLGSTQLCQAVWDVKIHAINHSGLLWRWTAGGGLGPNVGVFTFTGVHRTPISGTINAGARNSIDGMTDNSKITFNIDLQVSNRTTSLDYWMIGTTNVSVVATFVGKMFFKTADPTITPFLIGNSATNGTPCYKDFALQTTSTYIAKGGGAPVLNVPCMSVYSNVGFDPTLHAAVIEPVTVSPSVKV